MATTLKARIRTMLPAVLQNGVGIAITKLGLIYTIAMDWSDLATETTFDPSTRLAILQSVTDGSFSLASLSTINANGQTARVITAAGDVNVAASDAVIILNKTVGAATQVNMPASASKVGQCQIVDWKQDSDTHPITIVSPDAADRFNGATSWKINSPGSSVVLRPVHDASGLQGYTA